MQGGAINEQEICAEMVGCGVTCTTCVVGHISHNPGLMHYSKLSEQLLGEKKN